MKGLFILIAIVLISQSLCSNKKRYDGYKVLRVDVSNQTEFDLFFLLADKLSADVWAVNSIEGWADVMVTSGQAPVFSEVFQSKVHIEDVQATLDVHEEEMERIGAPTDIFDSFPTHGEIVVWLNQQIAAHPGVASRVSLGQTYDGRDIAGLRLASDQSRPIVFLQCGIHAREWITPTTCLWIIDQLLNQDPAGPQLTANFHWVIVPVLNIDGYDYTKTSDRLWRKNREYNSGSSCIGTDLNRNYAYGWGGAGSSSNPCAETFRGVRAFSAPETAAKRTFLQPYLNAGRVGAFVDIHAYGGMFMSPWGYTTAYPPDYNAMYTAMEGVATSIYNINGRSYAYGTSANVIYVAAGGSDDWTYGDGGVVLSFTTEAYGSSFTPPVSWIAPMGREIYAGIKRLTDYI